MAGHFFISYSRLDGTEFALGLADELEAGPEGYRVWLDQREMRRSRQDWDDQLTEAIQTCESLLFVMTRDSVRVGSGCKDEWVWALKYKKPVIPVRVAADADLPFRLGSRQFVDFSASSSRGLAQLRRDLRWLRTPAGQLRELEIRLAEAERELPRADPAQQPRIGQEIEELRRRIEKQRRLVADPQAVAEQTDARIGAGMERERQPERPVVAPPQAKYINPPPLTAPDYFQDRHVETGLIGDFLRADGLRMMSVVGRGGVGKTAMVCRLLKALEAGRLPDELGELAVDGIVYLSPLGAHPVDFAHLFPDLCRLLPRDVAEPLLQRYPQETPAALMRALLERFADGRWVLLLDNFEDVVDADGVGLTDSALEEALVTALRAPQHGVKVILTTRVAPRNVLLVQPGVQHRLNLDEGLPSPFAEEVLRAMDPDGSLGIKHAPDELLARARERTRGFPRALEALAAILAADRDTTLPELLASTESLPENVVEALVGEAFNRLDSLAQEVMQALAIYPAPVPPVAVDYLMQPFQPAIDSAPVLGRLVNMQFVRREAGRYYLHQVDRDYALQRVPIGEPSDRHADSPPFSQYALRKRAADYFEQTRTPRETWRTLDDLAPQLAEFELRYQAGDLDTAAQVLLDISDEYLQLWGHLRLARDLHERLHDRLTDPRTSANNLTALGNAYFFLGEVRRAIGVYEQALAIFREIGDRRGEGGDLASLGNGYSVLGEVRRAIGVYEQALAIFREIGDRRGEGTALTGLGSAHSALGEVRRAIGVYEQALAIDREIGDRRGEGADVASLGSAYYALGEVRRAIEFYEQSLAIFREIGHRGGEGAALDCLGSASSALGDVRRAIEFYEQALAIYREIGDRSNEGGALNNLGIAYSALGEVRRAIEFYEPALAIFRDIGRREAEAFALINRAVAYTDAGDWPRAIRCGEDGVRIADEVGVAQGSSEGRVHLAIAHLHAGKFDLARATALSARGYDYAPMSDNVALVLGIALAREGRVEEARHAFRDAANAADALLAHTAEAYDELDNRALALCGLALADDPAWVSEASEAFRAARAITCAEGIVARVVRLFDALAVSDETGILAPVRPAAAGEV
jgi:tetratricopeptide (TPR) repeat protein